MYEKILMRDFLKVRSSNVIDIRTKEEYDLGFLPHAINIPKKLILNGYDTYLHKNVKYYIYCQTGSRSKEVCELLSIIGYDVVDITDGYDSWLKLK